MITHRIVVHTPPAPAVWTSPRQTTGLQSQEELDKAIADCPFQVGDFLTLSPSALTSLNAVHYVLEHETDFKKVIISGYHKTPNFMHMLQCNLSIPSPWKRWDNPAGYRRLSLEEYNTFVLPHRDILQDYCAKWA